MTFLLKQTFTWHRECKVLRGQERERERERAVVKSSRDLIYMSVVENVLN